MLGCCLLTACGAADLARVPRAITTLEGVVITNGPALFERPEPRVRNDRLDFRYSLFAENHGGALVEIHVAAARAAFEPEPPAELDAFRVACFDHDPARRASPVSVLEPGERTQIDCHVELSRKHTRELEGGDRELFLGMPVLVRTGAQTRREIATFSYQLYMGDVR
jgi:hypothetical protein